MTDKWNQIQEILLAALECEPSERTSFLDQTCGNDQLLRAQVQSLLNNADDPLSIIDAPLYETIEHLEIEGHTLDHYRIVSRIGSGGMGDVYLAEDERLGRKVALKMLRPGSARDANHIHRMQKEARATAALNHPNIVTIYDVGQDSDLHYIAMEFIEGQTLRARMGVPLLPHDVVSIGIQVASGLLAAHREGILHRDIKPENVMIGVDGAVKILDFGIAQLKDPNPVAVDPRFPVEGATQSSVISGTPGYASPEQVLGLPLDARTDIFSLGVLLFELANGHRPFDAGDSNKLRPNVPSHFKRIIGKSVEQDRDRRYESIDELLLELREFSRHVGKEMNAKQRANEMFMQYQSIYAVDKHALIPLTKLYAVVFQSDLKRGEREKELIRKSLYAGLIKAGALALLIALATTLAAAWLSISETWEETILKDGHTQAVRQVAFSPDGQLLVSAGEDAKVIVWDFNRRMPKAVLTDHTSTVTSVAFSPDGKLFVTGSKDHSVIIWDTSRLQKTAVLQGLPGEVIAVAFTPDGHLLATETYEPKYKGHIALWNVGRWDKFREIDADAGGYGRLLFSPDGQKLITNAGLEWNIATDKSQRSDLIGSITWIASSTDGRRMLITDGGPYVQLIDIMQHRKTEFPMAHQDSGRAAVFSPDNRYAATGADDIILWDAPTMTKLARFEASSVVWNLVFSPDGRWLVSTHGDSSILIWDVQERKLSAALNGHAGAVRGVTFSPDGRLIASAAEDRSVILWNAETGRKVAVLQGPASRLTGVAFSPDGERVAASEFFHTLNIWNLRQDHAALSIRVNSTDYCVAIAPDNQAVVTTMAIYNEVDGHLIADIYESLGGQLYGATFSADGRWLAGAVAQNAVVLFDAHTWKLHAKVKVEATPISVSFSRDGKYLVTGEDEGNVRLWSTEPLQEIAILGRHTSRIKSVAFSPDGKQVASAGDDNAIRIWDVAGRRMIREIGTHTKPVLSVAYSPDGKRIVSGEHDCSVRLYTRHHHLWGHQLD